MALRGIDVSGWQKGINLEAVPSDFVICKATQGTSFVSDDFKRQTEQVLACGKLLGVYHYVGGSGATAEADHFVNTVAHLVGKAILVIDWESNQNSAWRNESYLDEVVKRVIARTGVKPLIYSSKSVFPWGIAKANDCGAWVAQYANNNQTGYQDTPWNEGAYTCAIRQYTSTGRLSGWSGNLDLNKAYMTREAWAKYAGAGTASVSGSGGSGSAGATSGDKLSLVAAVMRGEYGNGDARKAALGSRYDEVQSMINHIASASVSTLANEVWAGKYGTGATRKAVLGTRYDEVQAAVNGAAGKSVDELAREVIRGNWGNGSERKRRLEAAGYDYEKIQKRVNELM